MKKFFLVFLVTLFFINAFAGFVPHKDAKIVAKNHFYHAINSTGNKNSTNWNDIHLTSVINPETHKDNSFYVFDVNSHQGYVIVSSNSSIKPILAYSFESGFNPGNISPGQQMFLDYFNESIELAFKNKQTTPEEISAEWNYLKTFKPEHGFTKTETEIPLLGNIKWNQSWPYNAHCPEDPNAFSAGNGRVPVGCVATAMLQVMKYYNWPETGQNFIYHPSASNGGYGNYTITFSEHQYNWDNIPNTTSGSYNPDLAKINLHAAVSVRMWWGPHGSGSQTSRIADALKYYFKYSSDVSFIRKTDYSEANWKNILRQQITNKKPVVYSGTTTEVGHAWNCDGYQGDYFHMNWGWGGSGDGFYTLDNLNSTATPGGPENNFIYSQRAVINIYPKESEFPAYCSGLRVITGQEGSFEDGSSINNYLQNSSCTYVIEPVCGASVNLSFDKFDLAVGDEVKVFDGDEFSDILLAVFSADNRPNTNATVSGNRGALTLKFNTDDGPTAGGWQASYSVNFCVNGIVYDEPNGSFGDGSGECDYEKGSVCSWEISPNGAGTIEIDFTKFDLSETADFVEIYKNSMASANSVARFTAFEPPQEPVLVNSGVAVIRFFSDQGAVSSGWELNYTSTISNIESQDMKQNISLAPNPGNNKSNIYIYNQQSTLTNISIFNALGQLVDTKSMELEAGENQIQLNQISNSLSGGVYYINVNQNEQIYNMKLVVID